MTALTCLATALAVLATAPATAAARTVNFDTLVHGATVSDQYATSDGLTFVNAVPWFNPDDPSTGSPDEWTGVLPKVRADALAQSPPNVGDISGCEGEFCAPRGQTFGKFSEPQQSVSV